MDRRHLFRLLGASAALAGLNPSQLAALFESGGPRKPSRAFFTTEQRETIDALCEVIIPTTDTPGAVTAGVPEFIELIVAEWYNADDRARFMRGLAQVDERTQALTGIQFAQSGEDTQAVILSGLEAESRARIASGEDTPSPFFQQFRGLVLSGYYSSEIGLREELLYQPIPGRFDGCVDVSEVTRSVSDGD